MKKEPRNIDVDGKTRPTSTQGIAGPKTEGHLKEAERLALDTVTPSSPLTPLTLLMFHNS